MTLCRPRRRSECSAKTRALIGAVFHLRLCQNCDSDELTERNRQVDSMSSDNTRKSLEQYCSRASLVLISGCVAYEAWVHESMVLACTALVFFLCSFSFVNYRTLGRWWLSATFMIAVSVWCGYFIVTERQDFVGMDTFTFSLSCFLGFSLVRLFLMVSGRVRGVWAFCRSSQRRS